MTAFSAGQGQAWVPARLADVAGAPEPVPCLGPGSTPGGFGEADLIQVVSGAGQPTAAVHHRVVPDSQLCLDAGELRGTRGEPTLLLEPFAGGRIPIAAHNATAPLTAPASGPGRRGDASLEGRDRTPQAGTVSPQMLLRRLGRGVVVDTDRARVPCLDPEPLDQDLVPVVRLLTAARGGEVRVPRPRQVRPHRTQEFPLVRV